MSVGTPNPLLIDCTTLSSVVMETPLAAYIIYTSKIQISQVYLSPRILGPMDFPKVIYCSGIGGIGVSALAQLLRREGYEVSGSDRNASPVTEMLEEQRIVVHLTQEEGNITEDTGLLIY